MNKKKLLFLLLLPLHYAVHAQETKSPYSPSHEWVKTYVSRSQSRWSDVAMNIWQFAEVGYREEKSNTLLREELKKNGFRIDSVAGIPTAFVASYGEGSPVIGILGEYDALPGMSQEVCFSRKPINGKNAGHACGHNLFGAGSASAAVAVAEWMKTHHQKGTIRFFGCPAEEGGSGKVYMAKAGVFKNVDAMVHWHAAENNGALMDVALANRSGKFKFTGTAAHASASPEMGRSALDAVEAMDYMVNMMREHIPSSTRIHYVITDGGKAPNVVPDHAEVYYYVRHPEKSEVIRLWEWVETIAKAAAMGTQTSVKTEIIGGTYNLLPNQPLAKRMYQNLVEVGGVIYDDKDKALADSIGKTLGLPGSKNWAEEAKKILPFEQVRDNPGSTDVGDVSWNIPTTGLRTATWVYGTNAHSWQAVVAGGSSIGLKGMEVASKVLACTMVDLLQDPALVAEAKADFERRRGKDFQYVPLTGDRKPPLDYRK